MMKLKVIDGTPRGSTSLCISCRFSQVMRGFNFQADIRCLRLGNIAQRISFPIAECSGYENKATPSLYQMTEIAWSITSRVRGPVGFGEGVSAEVHIEPPVPGQPLPVPPTG